MSKVNKSGRIKNKRKPKLSKTIPLVPSSTVRDIEGCLGTFRDAKDVMGHLGMF